MSEKTKVVERFYRGDASRGTPGVGLGLSLVQAVAKLHGSALELSDQAPGLRVAFTFLSMQRAPPRPSRRPRRPRAAGRSPPRLWHPQRAAARAGRRTATFCTCVISSGGSPNRAVASAICLKMAADTPESATSRGMPLSVKRWP